MNKFKLIAITVALSAMAAPAHAGWRTTGKVDPISGKASYYTSSDMTKPIESPVLRSAPRAWLGVGCNTDGQTWAYIGFTSMHVPDDSSLQFDYRADSVVGRAGFVRADNGRDFLHFYSGSRAIEIMQRHNTYIIGIPFYGQGTSHFKFSLSGSSAAIGEIMAKCGIK